MDPRPNAPEIVRLLSRALHHIRATPPRLISSPATQPRRASVAIIIRVRPPPGLYLPPPPSPPHTLETFFTQPWVSHPQTSAELLFLPRGDSLAFPGGRQAPSDEGSLYTALRECWDQTGVDLADGKEWECVGQLDDREVTTGLGKRLLMVLSPFVFLCLTPDGGQLDLRENVDPFAPPPRAYWIPLPLLASPSPSTATVSVDITTRIAPRSGLARFFLRGLLGQMRFGAIVMDQSEVTVVVGGSGEGEKGERGKEAGEEVEEELKLWGLSLGMTLDLVAQMRAPPPSAPGAITPPPAPLGMSLTSIFPRFSVADVNFWIWVFGRRYRKVIRGWEESYRLGGANDRRINWSGSALSNFYASVRKALIMTVVCRAVALVLALWALGAWWFWHR